jgi:hypothetical protein
VTALAVINIKRSLDKNHAISERDAHILLAFLDAQANRTRELKAALEDAESSIRRLSDDCRPEQYDKMIALANRARDVLGATK